MDFAEFLASGRLESIRSIGQELRARKFTATSTDGLITVEALPTGQVVGLEIDPRVYRNPDSKGLSEAILSTMNKAVEGAAEAQLESLGDLTGGGAASFQSILENLSDVIKSLGDQDTPPDRTGRRAGW